MTGAVYVLNPIYLVTEYHEAILPVVIAHTDSFLILNGWQRMHNFDSRIELGKRTAAGGHQTNLNRQREQTMADKNFFLLREYSDAILQLRFPLSFHLQVDVALNISQ
jgi:hypothetical protein